MAEVNDAQITQRSNAAGPVILSAYYIVLALTLVHIIYNMWPSESKPNQANQNSQDGSVANKPSAPTKKQDNPADPSSANQPSDTTKKQENSALPPAEKSSPTGTTDTSSSPTSSGSNTPKTGTKTTGEKETQCRSDVSKVTLFGYLCFHPSPEMRLFLLVLAIGALGSFIHAGTSLADYVGNKTFVSSWFLWYILRPFIGMALALIFYFVVRAGFITAQTTNEATAVNPFGIATLAGLAGMFTKQATDKLNEVFTTFFKTAQGEGDDKRKNKLENLTLTISKVEPSTAKKGSSNTPLTLTGTNFSEKSVVKVNGQERETKLDKSTNSLSINLEAADLATAGELKITVFDPTSNATSSPATFTVTES